MAISFRCENTNSFITFLKNSCDFYQYKDAFYRQKVAWLRYLI